MSFPSIIQSCSFSLEVEWKLVYVGSSKDPTYDQVLDSFTMGPLEYGAMQFDLEVRIFKFYSAENFCAKNLNDN